MNSDAKNSSTIENNPATLKNDRMWRFVSWSILLTSRRRLVDKEVYIFYLKLLLIHVIKLPHIRHLAIDAMVAFNELNAS